MVEKRLTTMENSERKTAMEEKSSEKEEPEQWMDSVCHQRNNDK